MQAETVAIKIRPQDNDDFIDGILKLSLYLVNEFPLNRSCGRTMRIAKRITTGIAERNSDSQGHFRPVPESQFQYETPKPIANPPRNVNGKFFNLPKIAAA